MAVPRLSMFPGRVGSHPSFIDSRIAVEGLVDWIATGGTCEGFADALRIETDSVMAAFRYLNDDPPVEVVDLTDCPPCNSVIGTFRRFRVPVSQSSHFPLPKRRKDSTGVQRNIRIGL